MSYSDYEFTSQDGRPKYRLQFVIGTDEYLYSNEEAIIADSVGTWIPEAIDLSEFSQTNEMAKDPLTITFPRDNAFALLFQGGVPEQVCSVTVYRGHSHDPDEQYQFYWKGRVAGTSAEGDAVRIECENVFTSLRRPGLRAKYQLSCRHPLYNNGCKLNKDTFAVSAIVTSIDGFTASVTYSDSNVTSSYFTGGMIETTEGHFRYIITHNGGTLQLIRPLPSLEDAVNSSAGEASVTLYPGCAHTVSDCRDKFSNLLNYGGYPYIPSRNPFNNNVTGSIV